MAALLTTVLLDPSSHETAFDGDAAKAEFAQREMWAKTAQLYEFIHQAMTGAHRFPQIFVNTATMTQHDVQEFVRRSAILDLASRLRASEMTVEARWRRTVVLQQRLPRFWTYFTDGEVSEAQVREAARAAEALPESVWAQLDGELSEARRLTDVKFKAKAKALRERLHPESMTERHQRAMADREIEVEIGPDGMGWFDLYHSAAEIARAQAHVDALAHDLFKAEGETRTMRQLRADVAARLLTGELTGTGSGVTVALTVPVLTLLGHSDELPTLEGVGPIDIETAKRLVGSAKTFTRILTDPVRGTVLDIDRTKYKVPAAMRRWLEVRDRTCTAPGCNRRAAHCDLDHTLQFGGGKNGKTAVKNLAHLCEYHHRVKHNSRWKVEQARDGSIRWTSPTGHSAAPDPPPF